MHMKNYFVVIRSRSMLGLTIGRRLEIAAVAAVILAPQGWQLYAGKLKAPPVEHAESSWSSSRS